LLAPIRIEKAEALSSPFFSCPLIAVIMGGAKRLIWTINEKRRLPVREDWSFYEKKSYA
jgi:hypothetical protein